MAKRYTKRKPYIITLRVDMPMERLFELMQGGFGGKWNQVKSFTPKWCPLVAKEEIREAWPENIKKCNKNWPISFNKRLRYYDKFEHLGVAVTAADSKNAKRPKSGQFKESWSQNIIIDAGYVWKPKDKKGARPHTMVFHVCNGKYNAKVIFTETVLNRRGTIGSVITGMKFIEWGVDDNSATPIGVIEKFVDRAEKQFRREFYGKDRRNILVDTSVKAKGRLISLYPLKETDGKLLSKHEAAIHRMVMAKKMLQR